MARRLARTLAAAEAAGGARACLDDGGRVRARSASSSAASSRTFQAVKHHCADMLRRRRAGHRGAWDAARARTAPARPKLELAAAVAACTGAARRRACRRDEHPDARRHRLHVGARRAPVPAARRRARRRSSTPSAAAADVTRLTRDGVELAPRSSCPPEAESLPRRGPRVRRAVTTRCPPTAGARACSSSPGTSCRTGPSRGAAAPARSSSS